MSAHQHPVALISRLREDLGCRRIKEGIQILESSRALIDTLEPETKNGGVLLGLVAQWVDAGFDGPSLISRLLARFAPPARSALPLLDYLHVRMAEGLVAMSKENFEDAAGHFRFVQSLEGEVDDPEVLAIANFWTGRCLRKKGRYDDALNYIVRGEELALSCGYTQMAAIMQATRSWLAFQKGKLMEATTILNRADAALRHTDDFLSRGNIQSAYGRIARRQGRNERAVEFFERAIAEYRSGGDGQLQLARALLNLAFVRRLLALQRQKELDRASASRRYTAAATVTNDGRIHERRLEIARVRGEAATHLDESMAIFERHGNHRGMAGVHLNRGFLYLDSGDLECASHEAAEAFRYGHDKRDYIEMARSRTLQCFIEMMAFDEQIGDPALHHEAAEKFAQDAVSFAGQTQNRRLLARALVSQGLTFAAERYGDLDTARRCYDQAIALLQPEATERQYVWDDLETLKARVLRSRSTDSTLRAWSAGIVGERSFQQMTEEFARIVIPKVWEREGRKVSRVAQKLSISPKKVRRILDWAGLLNRNQHKSARDKLD